MELSVCVYIYIFTKISLPQEYAFNPGSAKLIKNFSIAFLPDSVGFLHESLDCSDSCIESLLHGIFVSVSTENSCYRAISLLLAFVLLMSAPSFSL